MNDNQLFHEIVEAHAAAVLALCASMLGPGPDAEDAWQETFVAALRAFPLDGVNNVEAWLVTVARRRCIDILRRSARERPVEDAGLHLLLPEATNADERDDDLWDDVGALSPRRRFVVVHRYVAQWSYPEIAEALGCSPAAARRSGADAVAALRAARSARAAREHGRDDEHQERQERSL